MLNCLKKLLLKKLVLVKREKKKNEEYKTLIMKNETD